MSTVSRIFTGTAALCLALCIALSGALSSQAFADGEGETDSEPIVTGWVKDGSQWRFYDEDGQMATGFVEWKGSTYYLGQDGVMATGWQKVSGYWFYFAGSGAMQVGWTHGGYTDGRWYYMDAHGVMATSSWVRYEGNWYWLPESGRMVAGAWTQGGYTDGRWYYMTKSGAMASQSWYQKDGAWYYLCKSGIMAHDQWLSYKGKWYYFKSNGRMATGWAKAADGSWYYLGKDGVMQTGHILLGNYYYTLAANGKWKGDKTSVASYLGLTVSFHSAFNHGSKPASKTKYIVLHETEGDGDGMVNVNYWLGQGKGVAAHFIVNKDGTVVQAVPLNVIAHHAGYGDSGHNKYYGISEDGRDDMVGSGSGWSGCMDYGMNAWSIGIEIVHYSGGYPEAQLEGLDRLIEYIDDYYGFECKIIDHKAWRSGNSDTSANFATYLANYMDHRTHD